MLAQDQELKQIKQNGGEWYAGADAEAWAALKLAYGDLCSQVTAIVASVHSGRPESTGLGSEAESVAVGAATGSLKEHDKRAADELDGLASITGHGTIDRGDLGDRGVIGRAHMTEPIAWEAYHRGDGEQACLAVERPSAPHESASALGILCVEGASRSTFFDLVGQLFIFHTTRYRGRSKFGRRNSAISRGLHAGATQLRISSRSLSGTHVSSMQKRVRLAKPPVSRCSGSGSDWRKRDRTCVSYSR